MLHHLCLRMKPSSCFCDHRDGQRREKRQTWRKHQQQELNVMIPAVRESPWFTGRLSHITKSPFMCATLPRPLSGPCVRVAPRINLALGMPEQFLIDSSFFSSGEMAGGLGGSRRKKGSSAAILFHCQCRSNIKGAVTVIYSPQYPFLH